MNPEPQPSLAEVKEAFRHWREQPQRGRTPLSLRVQAVGLLSHYRISQVLQELHLDHRRLSSWRSELSGDSPTGSDPDWVSVPTVPTVPTRLEPSQATNRQDEPRLSLTLSYEPAAGGSVSVSGELNAAQWRWALGLLREGV